MHQKSNKLINEKSPYLLQHAHNPVDWYPWGDEAFEKAKTDNKPIFLSIGYSTCHWCHVMEKETFEDEEAAQILNKHFICIKVDREERPDIDSIYMTVCQALTGSGGWPLTIFMTPDKKPFFAGTYFPKHSTNSFIGIIELSEKIEEQWETSKDKLINASNEVVNIISKDIIVKEKQLDLTTLIKNAYDNLKYTFEPRYGGFNTAPKFPSPHNLIFLLRYYKAYGDKNALLMAENTLKAMYKGGIFDHIGYGFSRYSVDKMWLVPHFEKMLYDNALLSMAYSEAYIATKNEFYKETSEKIYSYLLRDMKSESGGFYSAEDADSEGEEGKFYIWSYDEIIKLFGESDGKLFCEYYGITQGGNFEGKNIPNLINNSNINNKDKIEELRVKLFNEREKRIHPYKDDKILTSWNGLMIASLAYSGRILNKKEYIKASENCVSFILNKLIDKNGRLLARYRDNEAAKNGYADDYAFLIWGLIELYEATFNSYYIEKAEELYKNMLELFEDKDNGGLFLYGNDSENLILRPKELYDGAIPSGNSAALYDLLRLFQITGDEAMLNKAQGIINAFQGKCEENPSAYTFFITALLNKEMGTKKAELNGDINSCEIIKMIDEFNKHYNPFTQVVFTSTSLTASAHICENFSCNSPVYTTKEFGMLLDK